MLEFAFTSTAAIVLGVLANLLTPKLRLFWASFSQWRLARLGESIVDDYNTLTLLEFSGKISFLISDHQTRMIVLATALFFNTLLYVLASLWRSVIQNIEVSAVDTEAKISNIEELLRVGSDYFYCVIFDHRTVPVLEAYDIYAKSK